MSTEQDVNITERTDKNVTITIKVSQQEKDRLVAISKQKGFESLSHMIRYNIERNILEFEPENK